MSFDNRQLTRLRTFWGRPASGKRLRIQATVLLGAVRATLRLMPFARVRRLLERAAGKPLPGGSRHSREDVIATVQAAARDLTGCDCMTQALALRFLLVRQGYAADVHVGVAREASGMLLAHAWVESGGLTALCGTTDLSRRAAGSVLDFEI